MQELSNKNKNERLRTNYQVKAKMFPINGHSSQ